MRDHFTRFFEVSNAATATLAIACAYASYRQNRICTYGFWHDAWVITSYASISAWLMGFLAVTSGCLFFRVGLQRSMSYMTASLLIGPTLLFVVSWLLLRGHYCGC